MDTQTILTTALNNFIANVINLMVQNGKYVTGQSAAEIQLGTVTSTYGEVYLPSHFLVLEYGRGPGKTPIDFEARIRLWANAKGIQLGGTQVEQQKAINAIMWSIKLYGTDQHKQNQFIDLLSQPMETLLQEVENNITLLLQNEVVAITTNFLS